MELEEGDIVICTVEKITGTIVNVKIDETGQEGNIVFSEIAPGRIKNIRDYAIPKKKIICKILRKRGINFDLSLRRVTFKEQKQAKEQYEQEKSYKSILNSILTEKKSEEIIKEIQKKESLIQFLDNSKENSKELEKLIGKEKSKKILEIIKIQKLKEVFLKKTFYLKSKKSNGIKQIKEILVKIENAEIKYISAGVYSIKIKGNNLKEVDKKLKENLELIEKYAKENNLEFSIKEK